MFILLTAYNRHGQLDFRNSVRQPADTIATLRNLLHWVKHLAMEVHGSHQVASGGLVVRLAVAFPTQREMHPDLGVRLHK